MSSHRDNLRGIAAMLVAMAGFCSSDTMVKLASETMPLGEVMFVRGLVTIVFISCLAVGFGQAHDLGRVVRWPVLFRTMGEVIASILFLTALTHLPLPTATIIMQATPLAVAAAGAVILGEIVHWRRWSAIVVGFVGVVVVMRPGLDGFNAYSLLALASVLFVALRDISTKFIPRSVPTVLVVAVACVAVTTTGAGMGAVLHEPWHLPSGREIAILLAGASCLIVGYWFVTVSMRSGAASVSTPFRYSVIIWATLYGFFIWGDRPDLLTGIGTLLIIGSGLYTLHRERLLARQARARYDAETKAPAAAEGGG